MPSVGGSHGETDLRFADHARKSRGEAPAPQKRGRVSRPASVLDPRGAARGHGSQEEEAGHEGRHSRSTFAHELAPLDARPKARFDTEHDIRNPARGQTRAGLSFGSLA